MEEYTYMSTGNMLFICAEGRTWLLGDSEDGKKEKVLKLIKEKAPWKDLKAILDVKKDEKLREWCEEANIEGSGISFGSDTIYIDGEPIYGSLCRQIETMHREGLPLDPMVNFVRKMRENPSYRIRNQLWGFIEACQEEGGFTIAEDGDIMAYKVVSSDFKDKHTGTFDNSIGAVVEMPRSEVDDDPNNTCSSGLHFCAYSYVNSFSSIGDRLVLVKINPADVVSIPKDYGNAKARCCRYKVVSEINAPLKKTVWKDEEECPVQKKCSGLDLNVGDLIKADLSEYDFEYSDESEVVARVIAVDLNDEAGYPYKVRFFDGYDPVEWWIKKSDVIERFIDGNAPEETFESGDYATLYNGNVVQVMAFDYGSNVYVVKYLDGDGDVCQTELYGFDLSHTTKKIDWSRKNVEKEEEEEDDDFVTKFFDLFDNSSDEPKAKTFVRNWFTASSPNMIMAFLEKQYRDIVDADVRLMFMEKDFDIKNIMKRLEEWHILEYEGRISDERIWEKVKAAIEIWMAS